MGQGGRDFSFQSSFSFIAVSHFFRADREIYSIYLRVSNVRVIGAHRRLRFIKLLELKKRANGCRGASIQHPRHPRKLEGLLGSASRYLAVPPIPFESGVDF
jgi:hypothetical protein